MEGKWKRCGCCGTSRNFTPNNDRNSELDLRCQGYFQLFFWFAMLIGLFSPVALYFTTFTLFPIWSVTQRFYILFTINCSWLALVSPFGYFLLQSKIINKSICLTYSFCVCILIVASMVSIAFFQSQDPLKLDFDDATSDTSILNAVKDHFNSEGDIPEWLQEMQSQQKCCGFAGPEDWKLKIYPQDKPAIEDVPESCCVTKVVGCNLVLQYFHNKTDLRHWIWTDGCRKTIVNRLATLLTHISLGCLTILIIGIILITIYWCQLTDLVKLGFGTGENCNETYDNVQMQAQQIECPPDSENDNAEENIDDTDECIPSSGFASPGDGPNFGSGINSKGNPSLRSSAILQEKTQGNNRNVQRQRKQPIPMDLARVRSVQFNFETDKRNRKNSNDLVVNQSLKNEFESQTGQKSLLKNNNTQDIDSDDLNFPRQKAISSNALLDTSMLQQQSQQMLGQRGQRRGQNRQQNQLAYADNRDEDAEGNFEDQDRDPDADADPGDIVNVISDTICKCKSKKCKSQSRSIKRSSNGGSRATRSRQINSPKPSKLNSSTYSGTKVSRRGSTRSLNSRK